jgi:SAM-dependent methyltransferase
LNPTTRFDVFRRMFADLGTPLRPGMKVMDFGCGAGRLVHAALKQGFDAYGCDLYDVKYSSDWEGRGVVSDLKHEARLRKIEQPYRLPFDDASMDAIISDQVLEHVQNYPEAVAEMHRILRPGGCFLHAFPSRYSPVEGHIFVPLASFFHPRWWLWLWAGLGVRNEFQRGLHAREVVKRNADFLRHGTNYLTTREIKREFARYFGSHVAFVEHAFLPYSNRPRFLAKVPGGPALYRLLSARILYGTRDTAVEPAVSGGSRGYANDRRALFAR